MPVKYLLAAFGEPVEFHLPPELVDVGGEFLLVIVTVLEIFAHDEQTLHKERALYKVSAVVFGTERFHLAGVAIDPVGPYAVKTVGLTQEVHNFLQARHTFGTRDETALDGHDQTGDAETRATGGDNVQVRLSGTLVEMNALGGEP